LGGVRRPVHPSLYNVTYRSITAVCHTVLTPDLLRLLHVSKQQLKAITQPLHVIILDVLQLKRTWNDLNVPVMQNRLLARLEAEVKVACVLWVDTEGVHTALRIGFQVGREPALYPFVLALPSQKDTCNLPVSVFVPFWYFSCVIISSTFLAIALTWLTISSSRSL